ncbi:hypothetical protein LUZ60_004781 [Juncus effusus]|nr:hypothetical protein LUZ60_004781 [Juncus effusus]
MDSTSQFKAILFVLFLITPISCMNVIDKCWCNQPNWETNRQRQAGCSVGFAGKMNGNRGKDVKLYTVTDPSDDPPLFVKSFTTIDGRGVNVQIGYGSGIVLEKVTNVIIQGLRIHDCRSQPGGPVVLPGGITEQLTGADGDAIRLASMSKIWIDHNTLYKSEDGLLDVMRDSTDVTMSNNWFHDHDKVMLLGHDDGYLRDRKMRVTLAFNRFGPNCKQRMPRIRHGYAHIVNNLYNGWGDYAIGGSMGPSIKSQSNLFVAPNSSNKKVTSRIAGVGTSWNWQSVGDTFENGARFKQSGRIIRPKYNKQQFFRDENANRVRMLTKDAGAILCSSRIRC